MYMCKLYLDSKLFIIYYENRKIPIYKHSIKVANNQGWVQINWSTTDKIINKAKKKLETLESKRTRVNAMKIKKDFVVNY